MGNASTLAPPKRPVSTQIKVDIPTGMFTRGDAELGRKSSGKVSKGPRPSVEINSFPSIERFLTSGGMF